MPSRHPSKQASQRAAAALEVKFEGVHKTSLALAGGRVVVITGPDLESYESTAHVIDAATGQRIASQAMPDQQNRSMGHGANGEAVFVFEGTAVVFEPAGTTRVIELEPEVRRIALLADGSFVASGEVVTLHPRTGKKRALSPTAALWCEPIGLDRVALIFKEDPRVLRVFDQKGGLLLEAPLESDKTRAPTLTPTGKILATCGPNLFVFGESPKPQTITLSAPTSSQPLGLDDGSFAVPLEGGELAFYSAAGKPTGRFALNPELPTIRTMPDGSVVARSDRGLLCRLDSTGQVLGALNLVPSAMIALDDGSVFACDGDRLCFVGAADFVPVATAKKAGRFEAKVVTSLSAPEKPTQTRATITVKRAAGWLDGWKKLTKADDLKEALASHFAFLAATAEDKKLLEQVVETASRVKIVKRENGASGETEALAVTLDELTLFLSPPVDGRVEVLPASVGEVLEVHNGIEWEAGGGGLVGFGGVRASGELQGGWSDRSDFTGADVFLCLDCGQNILCWRRPAQPKAEPSYFFVDHEDGELQKVPQAKGLTFGQIVLRLLAISVLGNEGQLGDVNLG